MLTYQSGKEEVSMKDVLFYNSCTLRLENACNSVITHNLFSLQK